MTPEEDTIFARASGAGKAGVAVYRVSGPSAHAIAELLCRRTIMAGAPRLAAIVDPGTGEAIDRGLALFFEGPRSFTGEDVAEFHLHGSRAVEAAFGEAAIRAGARLAEPGEFTRRAFLNGKMDLAAVEALADLIDSETSLQRKQALGQLGGRLSALAEGWKAQLVAILAALEADIDFPDEEGVPAAVAAGAIPRIDALVADLERHLANAAGARRLREGVEAVIIGAPNAGKSTLLNALAGAEVAIVSPIAGTTRDVIEVRLDLGGVAVLVADTAGFAAASEDAIEAEGMRRAWARAEAADVRILVVDPSADSADIARGAAPPLAPPRFAKGGGPDSFRRSASALPTNSLPPSLRGGWGGAAGDSVAANHPQAENLLRAGDILLFSKSDLPQGAAPSDVAEGVLAFQVSAKTGEGMPEFLKALEKRSRDLAGAGEGAAFTRLRHAEAARGATDALTRARARVGNAAELAAEDVRLAARALMSITGAVDVEDVLGEIFSSFCIGK